MVTDGQVRVLRRKLLMEGKTQEAAAAGAGMSVRSARHWQAGPYPSQARKPHLWRTRPDPFAGVFDSDIAPLLAADERLRGGPHRLRPVFLLMPFGFHLAMVTLPSEATASRGSRSALAVSSFQLFAFVPLLASPYSSCLPLRPARRYPRLWI